MGGRHPSHELGKRKPACPFDLSAKPLLRNYLTVFGLERTTADNQYLSILATKCAPKRPESSVEAFLLDESPCDNDSEEVGLRSLTRCQGRCIGGQSNDRYLLVATPEGQNT